MAMVAGRNIVEGGRRGSRRPPNGKAASAAANMPDTESVIAAAEKEAELASALREQISKYKEEKAEKQLEVEEDVTREVRERIQETTQDIEDLSQRTSQNLSKLAELEKAQMELELGNRRKAQYIKDRAEPVRMFKEASVSSQAEVVEMLDKEEMSLRENRQRISQCLTGLAAEIQERYRVKEELEREIEQRRHELVIDRELLRARAFIEQASTRKLT